MAKKKTEAAVPLTLARIARDSGRRAGKKSAAVIIGCILLLVIILPVILAVLSADKQALTILLVVSAGVLALFLLGVRKGSRLKKEILAGNVQIICSPLNEKVVESSSDVDVSDSYYFYFNVGPGGRYIYEPDSGFDDAQVGDLYYLVLGKNRKGKYVPLYVYPADKNPPDAQVELLLQQSAGLTGEQMTTSDEIDRKRREVSEKLTRRHIARMDEARQTVAAQTPEQQAADREERSRLVARATVLKRIVDLMPVVFLLLGLLLLWLGFYGAEWYWRLAYTLAWLLLCYGPRPVLSRLEKQIHDLTWKVVAAGTKELPQVPEITGGPVLIFFSFISHFCNVIIILAIWGVL